MKKRKPRRLSVFIRFGPPKPKLTLIKGGKPAKKKKPS